MADHRVPSQKANHHILENTPPHPAQYRLQDYMQRNPHVAGDNQPDFHLEGQREGIPQPVVIQGEKQYPRNIDARNYNAAYYHPPPSPYPEAQYVHLYRDVGVAEAPPQPPPFAPEVQDNYNDLLGYGAQFPAADPHGAFPGVWPHPAAPANMPPMNGLRNLANRYLNNPDTFVNMLRIEPGPGGRLVVWIALELPDIF